MCDSATDELSDVYNVKIDFIEEDYLQVVESRGIDVSHKVLPIFTDNFIPKPVKSGELGACRQMQTLAFSVRAVSRG